MRLPPSLSDGARENVDTERILCAANVIIIALHYSIPTTPTITTEATIVLLIPHLRNERKS
jgi:hypothetical protein